MNKMLLAFFVVIGGSAAVDFIHSYQIKELRAQLKRAEANTQQVAEMAAMNASAGLTLIRELKQQPRPRVYD